MILLVQAFFACPLGKPQKSYFLSFRATYGEGGLDGFATKEKRTFFNARKKVPMAGPLRKKLFLRLP